MADVRSCVLVAISDSVEGRSLANAINSDFTLSPLKLKTMSTGLKNDVYLVTYPSIHFSGA